MDFEEIISKSSAASDQQFWTAMEIWLNSPHLINRRISSSVNLLTMEIECDPNAIINNVSSIQSLSEFLKQIWQGQCVRRALNIKDNCLILAPDKISLVDRVDNKTYLFVNKLWPRNTEKFSMGIDFFIVDKKLKSIACVHRIVNEKQRCLGFHRPYRISYDDDKTFGISVERANEDSDDTSIGWLQQCLFPRLLKWVEAQRSADDVPVEGSLNLVSPEKYTNLYCELKHKYGSEMVKNWPESTDPAKFVYEDIAIATYLLVLWEEERIKIGTNAKRQSFVDLGCGNGLLVHILTSEGHSGTGIDLRKRKIWNIYPSTTNLQERTIVPSPATLFPEVDWLIGNHSDELTPWIPVMAARSSYNCRFFLLPCCAHEFDGRKFQRENAAKSQYFEYIKYMRTVCEGCGFQTDLDKLRIPSTKRICLIGARRIYPKEKSEERDKIIEKLINARSLKKNEVGIMYDSRWSSNFTPRDAIERVRNCTRIDRNIIDEIITVVTSHLLKFFRGMRISNDPELLWNAGGQISLSDIATVVAPDTLKLLKNECGGLQTLLKNNGHIFKVLGGKVQLKIPGAEDNGTRRNRKGKTIEKRKKVKPCWFKKNHPDGCPVSDEQCSFQH